MPDILIRGMEMPKCGERHIVIRADGSVHDDGDSEIHWSAFQPIAKAVELPPHGDLIDLDERLTGIVFDEKLNDSQMATMTAREWLGSVDDIPTVIVPSNKEETE